MSRQTRIHAGYATRAITAALLTLILGSSTFPQSSGANSLSDASATKTIRGKASFYGSRFDGKTTASGEPFDHHDHTAAAGKSVPLGSTVKVTNLDSGKTTEVRINDRGPHVKGRKIDLSKDAAKEVGLTRKNGTARVKIEVIKPPSRDDSPPR